MSYFHPQKNDKGQQVTIHHPSQATQLSAWHDATQIATCVPGGLVPESISGIPLHSWTDIPTDSAGWEKQVESTTFDEPAFTVNKAPASGVVVVEPDGRLWVVSPTNQFGGYTHTFPKGRLDKLNLSFRANAIKEATEESGLRVELLAYLCDAERDTTTTRYYLARRIGGNPADMGWESQATHLVPRSQLAKFVTHKNDQAVLAALDRLLPPSLGWEDILNSPTLTSGHRILATINGFRRRYGNWPTVLRIHRGMANELKAHTLTATAWLMLETKVQIMLIDQGTLYAEGNGHQFEYDADHSIPSDRDRADVWIWGNKLVEGE